MRMAWAGRRSAADAPAGGLATGPADAPAGGLATGPADTSGGRSTGRGAWALTAVTAVTGGAVLAVVAPLASFNQSIQLPPWAFAVVFAVAFAVAEIAVVDLPLRKQLVKVSFADIPLVIGLLFVAPVTLVAAQLLGTAAVLVAYRRLPIARLAFRLALVCLATSLVVLMFRAGAVLVPATLPGWLAAYPAILGEAVVVALAAGAFAALVDARDRPRPLRAGLVIGVLVAVVNTSVALLTGVEVLDREIVELFLMIAPVVTALLAYRAFATLREREARLEFLYECARVLQRPLVQPETLTELLALARGMFRADVAEILLSSGDDGADWIRAALGPGPATEMLQPADPDLARGRLALVSTTPGGLLLERPRRSPAVPGPLAGEGLDDGILVPLLEEAVIVGTLMVARRLGERDDFDRDDLRLLEALGGHVGVAFHNARLVDRLARSLGEASQLAAVVQSSDDAIIATRLDGTIASWNQAATRLFGYPGAEVTGRPATTLIPPGRREEVAARFAGVSTGGSVRHGMTEILHRDGTRVPVSATVSPIVDRSGAISGLSAILRDETERTRAETALRESVERFRSVFQDSPIGMGLLDSELRWTRVNEALGRMLERDPDELTGRRFDELIHPDDLSAAHEQEGGLFAGERTGFSTERRYVTGSGRVAWATVTARPLAYAGAGTVVGLCMIEDVTANRLARQRVRETEARLRRAIAAFTAVREPAGVLRAVLAAARDLLDARFAAIGVLSEDGSRFAEMLADGIDEATVAQIGQLPTACGVLGLVDVGTGPLRLADARHHPAAVGFPPGHPEITSLLAVPIVFEGRLLARLYVGSKREALEFSADDEVVATALAAQAAVVLENAHIHARTLELVEQLDRANAELKQASEAKSEFLTTMSHELRTPLHSILVAAELIGDPLFGTLTEARIRELARTIHGSGTHLLRLVDDLVDLSRIEAGRLELRPVDVPVSTLLGEILEEMTPLAREKDISLEMPLGPGPRITADPLRIRQVLGNLVANAIKFTGRGGRVWVEVSASLAEVRISVHDSGIGIAAEDLGRVFLPFEQVAGTSTPGVGLGLAISQRIVELHGGRFEAASTPGVGSTFSVTLPTGPTVESRPTAAEPQLPPESLAARRPASILVVEDDPEAMTLAADLLTEAGYEVWRAAGLAQALTMLDARTPESVLLDMRLGDGDGLEVARRIRATHQTRALPILVMSAEAMPDDVRRALAAGCDDYLTKPVSPRDLLARIRDLLVRDGPPAASAASTGVALPGDGVAPGRSRAPRGGDAGSVRRRGRPPRPGRGGAS